MTKIAKVWLDNTASFPRPANPEALKARWDQWRSSCLSGADAALAEFAESAANLEIARNCLSAIFGNSQFLSQNLINDPSLAQELIELGPDAICRNSIGDVCDFSRLGKESTADFMTRMRVAKSRVATAAAVADFGLHCPVLQVTGWLTELAAGALQASCCHLLREASDRGQASLPDPTAPHRGSGLVVLGMGKLGACELNFSSDVDVIILFDEQCEAVQNGRHQRMFSRLARNLVTLMAKRTAKGYVFRTDLRLRPDPGSTPPAISIERAQRYYQTLGQTWERAAMIKARPVAGDLEAGQEFLDANSGFVWRRNLDFPALRDIQAMKRRINAHKGGAHIAVEGHNVKLGRGGIREIEFLTQTRQLIWGGQNRALRGRGTMNMLEALAVSGRISVSAATELKTAYQFLRTVEHRIQMVDDQQTHSLPDNPAGISDISIFLGFETMEAFRSALIRQLKTVERHYNSMFEQSSYDDVKELILEFQDPAARDITTKNLEKMGYDDGEAVYNAVCSWIAGNIRAAHTGRAREILKEISGPLIREFAGTANPSQTFGRFQDLLSRMSRSLNLLSSIAAEASLVPLLADIMGNAPRLAEWISQQPGLIEGVLHSDFVRLDPTADGQIEPEIADAARRGLVRLFYEREFKIRQMAEDLADEIVTVAGETPDLQEVLDAQRRWVRNRKFQIGIHMLRGDLSPTDAAKPLSGIAETCLISLLERIKRDFAEVHGLVDGGQLAVLACGRLGSQEMTLSSDLDLIFVYAHAPDAAASDGRRPYPPTQYYAKLCRRFLNGVTAPTAEGKLYEVDMRLRPSGKSGPIACSIERFESYQRNDAWTWEHQALTRARVIYAEVGLRKRLNAIIRSVLTKERDAVSLAQDIRSMRQRIRGELEEANELTIKFRRGGILDLEFIAQFLQLKFASSHAAILLRDACTVFQKSGELGLIDSQTAEELYNSLQFWRNIQGIMLLTVERDRLEDNAAGVLKRLFGGQSSDLVLESIAESISETADRVSAHYENIIR